MNHIPDYGSLLCRHYEEYQRAINKSEPNARPFSANLLPELLAVNQSKFVLHTPNFTFIYYNDHGCFYYNMRLDIIP